jgi:hypothetical protein
MHLYFMVRGIISQVKLFETFMQAQMFLWKRKNLKIKEDFEKKTEEELKEICFKSNIPFTNKKEIVDILSTELCQVQGSLRVMPFGYEYVFPEECLDEVLTMLDADSGRYDLGGLKKWAIRYLIGRGDAGDRVKPIPKYKKVPTNRYIEKRGVALYFIGIKKDSRAKAEDWGYEQEML